MATLVEVPEDLAQSLKELAARKGRPLTAVVSAALEDFLEREAKFRELQDQLQQVVESIRANVPAGIDPETVDRDVDEAVRQVRARRARSR